MRVEALVFALLASAAISLADEPLPLGNRYDSIPSDARDVVKGLKKIEARTEIGVNYVDYDRAVSDLYPDVKIFLESAEARNLPELRALIANAMDCYLEVRRLWGITISGDGIKKYDASMTLITAQPVLWKTAGANISGATALLESSKDELPRAFKSVVDGLPLLSVDAAMERAEEQLTDVLRDGRAQKSGIPVPEQGDDWKPQDLSALLFQDGEFGDGVVAGKFTRRLPRIYESVPPAAQEGELPFMVDGKRNGGIAGLIYDDPRAAQKAFDAACQIIGKDRKRVSGLGNIGTATESGVVFRRGNIVVHAFRYGGPAGTLVEGMRQVDQRLAKTFGAGQDVAEPEAPEERPAAAAPRVAVKQAPVDPKEDTDSDKPVIDVRPGDFGSAIEVAEVIGEVPAMFLGVVQGTESQGAISLKQGGRVAGGVSGFRFGEPQAAKENYKKIAATLGKGAVTVPRLGDEASAAGTSPLKSVDCVFRVGTTVIFIRCPAGGVEEAAAYARTIASRLSPKEEKVDPIVRPTVPTFALDVPKAVKAAKQLVEQEAENASLAEMLLKITENGEWSKRGASGVEGALTEITDDEVAIQTHDGEVRLPVSELSTDSKGKLLRLKDLHRRLAF